MKWKSGRVDRLPIKGSKDPYRSGEKPTGGAVCEGCGATVREGRWTWNPPLAGAVKMTCPACRRVADSYPAGSLTLSGPFFEENRREIMGLIDNVAEAETNGHPLERLMGVRKEGKTTLVTTTGVHLARRLGDSLKRAYRGDLEYVYEDEEDKVRVTWSR